MFPLIIFLWIYLGLSKPALSAPPLGFQTLNIVSQGLEAPTALEILPDGRIFILEQNGKIKVFKNQILLTRDFAEISVSGSGERGLLGVAADPDFNTNHFVYFHYIDTGGYHRVVRFDSSTDYSTSAAVDIYKSPTPTQNIIHKGGTIQFGPDGKLYVSIGDDYNGLNSQNLNNIYGKLLRLNKDGTVPSDNPFVSDPSKLGEIYAYGLRNPFRFQFDKDNGKLYLGDVGEATWEEVNLITSGGNYGWPTCEGNCNQAGFINPIFSYNHEGSGASITGGLIYRGVSFPSEYQSNYFFGDYVDGDIYRLTFNPDGTVAAKLDFDLDANSAVDLKQAPDGSIYYVTIYPPALKKIVYNSGNQFPVASFTATPSSGISPLSVNFNSSQSSDPEGSPLSFLWTFGDGTSSTQTNPTHTYSVNGSYIVKLIVSDGVNQSSSSPLTIDVGVPPEIVINAPSPDSKYNAGQIINYNATSDGEIETEIVFHHNTHTHPFYGPAPGGVGSFTIPTSGESAVDTWYEIIFIARTPDGVTSQKTLNIYPNLSSYTLSTVPAGLKILSNGQPVDPGTYDSVVGFQTLLDISPQTINGIAYEFDRWSDGGPKSRTITTSTSSVNYIAHFREVPSFEAHYFNNKNLSSPSVFTTTYPQLNFSWGAGSPAPEVLSDSFSARFQKTQFFPSGKYTFTTTSDDGVRLYIDNNLLIDKWFDQGATSYSAVTVLGEGNHEVRLEYYENQGDASLSLSWNYEPILVSQTYNVEYFNNQNLTQPVAATFSEESFMHDWGSGSPAGINNDHFSARAVKTVDFSPGLYRFIISADDGVRFFIDNRLILDKWIDEPPTRYTIDKYLSGPHTVKIEYYENFGGAIMKFNYQKISSSASSGFLGEYYPNQNSTGVPLITRYDPQIQFNWGNGSPSPVLPVDKFSVRWSEDKTYEAGNYRFTITVDDGAKIYLDGQKIFDRWIDQPPTTYTFDQVINAGEHRLVIEYYENGGGAFSEFNLSRI